MIRRSTLLEAEVVAADGRLEKIGCFATDRAAGLRYRKAYFEGMKARLRAGKGVVAWARKSVGIIYRTLKNNWMFEDFGNIAPHMPPHRSAPHGFAPSPAAPRSQEFGKSDPRLKASE